MERLQRVLASHGIASRRKAEDLILAGRVTVDGQVVRELGTQVDPRRHDIRVDGQRLHREQRRYIMLNKPTGYITTARDERGRRTVLDLVQVPERVVPVGRLDRQTAGLLLLTNDGDIAFRVTHPRYGVEKEYEALLDGHPPPAVLEELRRGVTVDGERVRPEQIRPLRNEDAGTVLRIVIQEGRNRIVRRMLDRVGYPVLTLTRTRVGPLQVRGLRLGAWRDLTDGELEQLRSAVHLGDEDFAKEPPRPRPQPEPVQERRPPTGRARTQRPPGVPSDRPGKGSGPARPSRPSRRPGERRSDERGGAPSRGPGRTFGRKRGEQGKSSGGRPTRPPGRSNRRSGGGRQDRGRPRGRPPA